MLQKIFSKIFNSKNQSQAQEKESTVVNELRATISNLKSEYQNAISANNSILQDILNINNDVKGKNVLKAHKENRQKINDFITSAIEKNCEKNQEVQEKYN